jgi:hypothetical protein
MKDSHSFSNTLHIIIKEKIILMKYQNDQIWVDEHYTWIIQKLAFSLLKIICQFYSSSCYTYIKYHSHIEQT